MLFQRRGRHRFHARRSDLEPPPYSTCKKPSRRVLQAMVLQYHRSGRLGSDGYGLASPLSCQLRLLNICYHYESSNHSCGRTYRLCGLLKAPMIVDTCRTLCSQEPLHFAYAPPVRFIIRYEIPPQITRSRDSFCFALSPSPMSMYSITLFASVISWVETEASRPPVDVRNYMMSLLKVGVIPHAYTSRSHTRCLL